MSRLGQQLQAASPACGQATTVTLGARSYILRAPLEPCRPSGAPLPLMVLIHCFGCDAASEIQKYSEAADAHGFVLAAPEGYQNSWNAPHCCGPAREEAYDDVGFIDAVVKHSGSLLPIAPDAIFAAGFSNGGFMSSHLAWTGATRWAGLSPASGHEYSVNADRPMPVYMHHCGADIMVKMAGCCVEDGAPTCCCGIGSQRKTCVSTASLFEQVAPAPTRTLAPAPTRTLAPRYHTPSRPHPHHSPSPHTTHDPTFTLALALTATSHREQWLAVNKCSGSQPALGPAGAQCTTGTGCAANATLCVHEQCYHQMWARSFPAADAVVEFFARAVRACPPLSEPHAPWPCLTVTGHASWGRQVRRHLPLP